MSAPNYRRVAQREGDNLEGAVLRSRTERLQDKGVAVCWVLLAYVVARWTKFFSTLWSSNELNRTLLWISYSGLIIVVALGLYLIVYLPRVKGLSDSSAWNIYCPRVIPTMAIISLVSFLIFLRAIWPVFGFLAPVVSTTELMGAIMATNLIPTFGLC